VATREVMKVLCDELKLKVNLDNLDETVEVTRGLLENFGLVERSAGERRKKESQFRWLI
jgi:proteasome assembly chaperone (PAC2) family protein